MPDAQTRRDRLDGIAVSLIVACCALWGLNQVIVKLTIPTVAIISLILDLDLELGLRTSEIALLALTLFVSALTVAPGRATMLEGTMHLAIFAGFIIFVLNP